MFIPAAVETDVDVVHVSQHAHDNGFDQPCNPEQSGSCDPSRQVVVVYQRVCFQFTYPALACSGPSAANNIAGLMGRVAQPVSIRGAACGPTGCGAPLLPTTLCREGLIETFRMPRASEAVSRQPPLNSQL